LETNAANAAELIAAIRAANAAPDESHTIHLTGQDSDYVLFESVEHRFGGNGLPIITSDITIYGNGRAITRSAHAPTFRFFDVNGWDNHTRARLVLNDLTLAYGDSAYMGGGAIVNDGILIVKNCILRENHGTLGGAIYAGDLHPTSIISSIFIYNLATQQGGAVYGAHTCQLQVSGSLFYENLSPSGASHILESVEGTTHIRECFKWDGEVFERLDNVPAIHETPPADADQILLRQALSDTQRITDLHGQKPATRYRKHHSSESWWRDHLPTPTVESLISQAETAQSVPAFDIDRLIYGGHFQAVHDLALAVNARENVLRSKMELMSQMLNHIQVRLANMPGVASIEALLRVAEFSTWEKAAAFAAWVAHAQTQATVIEFFDRNGEMFQAIIEAQRNKHTHSSQLEFLVALTQEMVLRGLNGESVPSVKNLVEKLQKSYRYVGSVGSLRDLPLVLLEMEAEIGSLSDDDFTPPRRDDFDRFDADMPTVSDVPLPPFAGLLPDDRILAAVAKTEHEERVYWFETPLMPDKINTNLLRALNLSFVDNPRRIGIQKIPPRVALEMLFQTAGYAELDHPNTRAYKRFNAWESTAGLAGASRSFTIDRVQEVANACHWFYFWVDNSISNVYPRQLNLVVLRPAGRTLAVLMSFMVE
jgi:predicted outer membrane repeat protein